MHLSVFSRNRTEPTDQFSLVRVGSVCSGSGRVSWVLFLILFLIFCVYLFLLLLLLFFVIVIFVFLFIFTTKPNRTYWPVQFGSVRLGLGLYGSSQNGIYIYIVLNICQKVTHSLVESVLSSLHLVLGSNLTYVIYFSS